MQRAAAGLASVCAGLAGKVYGARIVVLAGSGDNGGDALYAGARLARRGACVVGGAAGARVHPAGGAGPGGGGGRGAAGGARAGRGGGGGAPPPPPRPPAGPAAAAGTGASRMPAPGACG